MELPITLDQPDTCSPSRSRTLRFGPKTGEAVGILNGMGERFEGGGDAPDLSLKWFARGAGEYRSEKRAYRLSGPIQLLLNSGQPYRMRMIGASESFVVFFPKSLADKAWQSLQRQAHALPEIPTAAAAPSLQMQNRLAALRTECRKSCPNEAHLNELLCALLGDVVETAALRRDQVDRIPALRSSTRAELLRRLLRAEAYLGDSGAGATLGGAAQAAALSPFHLIRLFDAVFGETPLAYGAGQRLERARDQIAGSNRPIADIALDAGYESRTAFDRAFRRRFRLTPGTLRAAAR